MTFPLAYARAASRTRECMRKQLFNRNSNVMGCLLEVQIERNNVSVSRISIETTNSLFLLVALHKSTAP